MISFFKKSSNYFFAVEHDINLENKNISKLNWLFGDSTLLNKKKLIGSFIGPLKEMTTPWSTNAVEITKNVGIDGIIRIEILYKDKDSFDPMTEYNYSNPDQNIFKVTKKPENVIKSIEGKCIFIHRPDIELYL